ncbi:MAG: dienelactone hydrolase family protein [Candidatus Rokubacteria bacterium]|nr:dienelactone hydrolase family protein [Candidatus Rokubacteria bacterium]MBI2555131.1 dienelactone hydrolase family protein [Candidatus Rokubacteria bacterium]
MLTPAFRALVLLQNLLLPARFSQRSREFFLALAVGASGVLVSGASAVELVERQVEYSSGDIQVPALLLLPMAPGPHATVLFIHGRSGLNERVQASARWLAARGFAVLAPDYHTGRFIPENPIDHDPSTEQDVERGLDYLKTVSGVRADRVAVVGLSRGGYHAALLGVRRPEVAGVVGYYPHLASPNAPEPVQVYRYMPEVEQWKVPALLMVGDQDHQLRREQVVRVAERLKERGVPVELVVYPGAQRAFDFRRDVRTVGDDLAREDALNRTVRFLNRVLGAKGRERE